MRVSVIAVAMIVPAILRICGSDDQAPPSTTATAPAGETAVGVAATVIEPKFGGHVIVAGQHQVEVLPMATGEVHAVVMTPQGAALGAQAGATLVVKVRGADGAEHPVQLAYDAQQARYVGRANVQIAPGPVEVTVNASGASATGRAERVVVVQPPQHGGSVVIAGDVAGEVKVQAGGEIHAWVAEPTGAEIQQGATVTVEVQSPQGPRPVQLAWNAEAGHWVGSAGVDVRANAPVVLICERNGARHRGRIEAVAVAPAPQLGGHVAIVGDYAVELAPKAGGEIEAVIVNDQAVAIDGTAGVDFTVNVGAEARPVVFRWNAQRRKWVGNVDATVDITTAPVEVVVIANGRRRHGRFGHAFGRARAGGDVMVATPQGTVDVHGVAGRVDIRGPRGRLLVGPNAAGGVEVRGPRGAVTVDQGAVGNVRVTGPRGAVTVTNTPGQVNVQGPRGQVVVQGAGAAGGGTAVQVRRPAAQAGGSVQVGVQAPQPPPPPRASGSVSVGGSLRVGN